MSQNGRHHPAAGTGRLQGRDRFPTGGGEGRGCSWFSGRSASPGGRERFLPLKFDSHNTRRSCLRRQRSGCIHDTTHSSCFGSDCHDRDRVRNGHCRSLGKAWCSERHRNGDAGAELNTCGKPPSDHYIEQLREDKGKKGDESSRPPAT